MHAMHVLEQQYGWEVLRQKRILLIHAGGYSQRTPTTSCLGKIATSIPKGVIRIIYLMRIEKMKIK
jgi:fucose-1-phosphate guanylyltransferase